MGAFRIADGSEVLEAPTKDGVLRLEVAPRHVILSLGAIQVAVSEGFATVTERNKRRSERIAGGLLVARDVPHEDLGLWIEVEPGAVRRIFGAMPRDLYAEDGLSALRALDRLSARLREHAANRRAFEVGRGLDKVLVADDGDRLVVYARHLFGQVARRVAEVHRDGTIVLPGRQRDRRCTIHERWGVVVTGDAIRFMDQQGTDLGRIVLHWIDAEDRLELARRFGDMVEGRHLEEPSGGAGGIAAAAAVHAGRGRYQSYALRTRLPRRK